MVAQDDNSAGAVGRFDAVIVDVSDLASGARFWSRVLGVEPIHEDSQYLRLDRQAGGPHVILQKVPEPKVGQNRVHLDFRVMDVQAAQARVEAMGGQKLIEDPTDGSVVMADPDGNEFCLVKERPSSASPG